jgi:hypothetical protein
VSLFPNSPSEALSFFLSFFSFFVTRLVLDTASCSVFFSLSVSSSRTNQDLSFAVFLEAINEVETIKINFVINEEETTIVIVS